MIEKVKVGYVFHKETEQKLKDICKFTRLGPSAVLEILITGEPKSQFDLVVSLVHTEQDSTQAINSGIGS